MMYLGDYKADQAIYFVWNTNDSDGASITRSGDGTISVYKDASNGTAFDTTQVTTGITNDEDFDALTGVHTCCITTTDAWYETGHDYVVMLSASTVDTQTVNSVIAHFSIENRLTIDDIWDEILTGATHNVATSAGRRIREIGAFAIHGGTSQAGNSHTITLAATADANDGIYNRNLIVLTDNTGVGQTRTIVDYDGTSKVVIVDRDWRVSPDATTVYQIVPNDTPLVVDHGVAQAGTATTITLRSYASAVNDIYLCNVISIIAGTGRGQARLVGSYDGTSKIVTICGDNWATAPDATSVYVMMPYGTTCTSCIGDHAIGQIDDTILDGNVEGTHTLREIMRLLGAYAAGKSSGGGTATITFRDIDDTKDRIVATVTTEGNRTAVTLTED